MSLLKLRVFSPKKTFSTCNCASPLPPFPPYNFIRPLLKYRHYTTQCLEFPSFISLQLTIHFFLPPLPPLLVHSSSLFARLLFSLFFFLSPLPLPFFLEAKNSYLPRQAMQHVPREAPTHEFLARTDFLRERVFLSKQV